MDPRACQANEDTARDVEFGGIWKDDENLLAGAIVVCKDEQSQLQTYWNFREYAYGQRKEP